MADLHVLQHVPYETPGGIATWATERRHRLTTSMPAAGDDLPSPSDLDLLVILGGPMSAYNEDQHFWMGAEKDLVQRCHDADVPMLGVCLGAQVMADALGGDVTPMEGHEQGWFPVRWTEEARDHPILDGVPDRPLVFHWHGDVFTPPDRSLALASSEPCDQQGFLLDDRVLGLQFHLEITPEAVDELWRRSGEKPASPEDDPPRGPGSRGLYERNQRLMSMFLDRISGGL